MGAVDEKGSYTEVWCARQVGSPEALGAETDRIKCETASPVLVSRYVVNQGCFGGDSNWIDCETASPVLVLGYVVNGGCLEVTLIGLIVKPLWQCLC